MFIGCFPSLTYARLVRDCRRSAARARRSYRGQFALVAVLLGGLAAAPAGAQQAADASPVVPQQLSESSPLLPQARHANQYSSNEVINAGHHFFGGISHGLASIVEKAVSQRACRTAIFWGKRRAAHSSVVCATARAGFTPKMRGRCGCFGRGPRSASTTAPMAIGP